MQKKKYFLLLMIIMFFFNISLFSLNWKEKFNQNKTFFITTVFGITALASYFIWYFLSSQHKKNTFGIKKKNLQNNIHNLIQFIGQTNNFIKNYPSEKKDEDFNQKVVHWKTASAIQGSLSSNHEKLKEGTGMLENHFKNINNWFNIQSKNIEKCGNAILDIMFYQDNQQKSSLYIPNDKYVLVDIYKQSIDDSSLYFRGLDLFNAAEQKNIKNVNVFEYGGIDKHEISKYGFYEYTSQLLTPKFESQ